MSFPVLTPWGARAWYAGLLAVIVAADQLTKAWIAAGMTLYQSIPVIGDWVRLTYVRNTGAAFSLMANSSAAAWRLGFLIGTAALALIVITVLIFRDRRPTWVFTTVLGLIAGGAAGNLIDRARFGEVVDFVDMGIGRLRWPVYNVADSAVFIGGLSLILWSLWRERRSSASGT